MFLLLALLLMLPVLSVFAAWLPWSDSSLQSGQILLEMSRTVLPDYALTTLWLCLLVAAGVSLIGLSAAVAVTLFEFPGRRLLAWALLLPLAMPAYVVAYAYTDFFQYSGPLQNFLRLNLGLQGRVFPEVRSLGGAAWVFTFTLYPYVYLLARTALGERSANLMEAARLLGAPLRRRILAVALPLARPAVAAGVALALMETLADFGVASYFGIQTFSAGIYKAWLAMDNRVAAAQLAALLLLLVALLLGLERRAQSRLRFGQARGGRSDTLDARPLRLRAAGIWLAWLVCGAPVLLGFVLPVLFMLRPLLADGHSLPWGPFVGWAINSLRLASISALLAVGLALLLAFNLRRSPSLPAKLAVQLVGLGYAVPGAVLVVRFSAVALQSVQSAYARIPASLDDSARMLGNRDGLLLRRVHWPLLQPSLAAAALLVFVDVMKELPATLVLRPFNSDTLAVVAYQLARDERLGEAALPALALVLVGLLPVLLLNRALGLPGAARAQPRPGLS